MTDKTKEYLPQVGADRLIDKGLGSVEQNSNDRISAVWGGLVKGVQRGDIRLPLLIIEQGASESDVNGMLHALTPKESYDPNESLRIPLNGDGELRLGCQRTQLGEEKLILGILTTGAHFTEETNEQNIVSFDDIVLTDYAGRIDVRFSINHQKNIILQKNSIRLFLALFDPKKDIDFTKMGTPTAGQQAVLNALGAKLPGK